MPTVTPGMPAVNTKRTARIGIRAETLHRYERRTALTPDLVAKLVRDEHIEVIVQRSPQRVFPAQQYRDAGAQIVTELGQTCPVVFGVKGIPEDFYFPGLTTVQFSHVHKGQEEGMPYLRAMMDNDSTLIDYELMVGRDGNRVVAFGYHSGFAGMTDSLYVLGRRLASEGFTTPLASVRRPFDYDGNANAGIKNHLAEIGRQIRETGLPDAITPFIVGFTGGRTGRCSTGAQEVFDSLGVKELRWSDVCELGFTDSLDRKGIYKVVFDRVGENGRYRRIDGQPASNQDFLADPAAYESNLGEGLGRLAMLIPCHLWFGGQPPLVTPEMLSSIYGQNSTRLTVVSDVTCDIWPNGAIASTREARTVERAFYVYDPKTGTVVENTGQAPWEGEGIVVNACETMPCMVPKDASIAFSRKLEPYAVGIARGEYGKQYESGIITLPEDVRPAVILWNGAIPHAFKIRSDGFYGKIMEGLSRFGLGPYNRDW